MNETRVFADEFQTSFASATELLEFLAERAKTSKWIRRPTKALRLRPLAKEADSLSGTTATGNLQEIVDDTEKNTQLALKVKDETFPVRDCAIQTILSRAGVSGPGLRKLDTPQYAKVVNYCLQVAKGDALVKVADGKVSAVHGGDAYDYQVLDMKTVFEMTIQYLNEEFKGSVYIPGSGTYDHEIVSAMWELGGRQELLDTYQKALNDHGINAKVIAPVLRLATSDVAASGANLYPMLLCESGNRTISLGNPIKLAHKDGADLNQFSKNLKLLYSRYTDAITDLAKLMDIEIKNPLNCLMLVMKKIGIKKKIANEVLQVSEVQFSGKTCTAHDLYFALNEASFFAACDGMQGHAIISQEENIMKALALDWEEFDVCGFIKW